MCDKQGCSVDQTETFTFAAAPEEQREYCMIHQRDLLRAGVKLVGAST